MGYVTFKGITGTQFGYNAAAQFQADTFSADQRDWTKVTAAEFQALKAVSHKSLNFIAA